MLFTPLIDELIESFKCLPGVGQKTAQRMAFHLLERNRLGGARLADVLQRAMNEVKHCQRCRNFSEEALCTICRSQKRDAKVLCLVESPADVIALEQAGGYCGRYFVLMGHLSPIDGIGPEDIGVNELMVLVEQDVDELIIATNPTVEGEATAHYIAELVRPKGIKTTRIAHGVPIGGELEFVDGGTLAHAINGRRPI